MSVIDGPAVILDLQPLQYRPSAERGIGRYLTELIKALQQWAPGSISRYVLNPDLPVPSTLDWVSGAAAPLALSDREPPADARIYHVTSLFEPVPLRRIWPRELRELRLVVTLHDLIPFVLTDHYLRTPDERRWFHTRLQMLRHADRVLAISEATARDAIDRIGIPERRVIVTGEAPPRLFTPAHDTSRAFSELEQALPSIRAGYVIYPGGMDPRKNFDALLEAYAGLPPSLRAAHQLVVLGALTTPHRRLLDARASELGISGEVLFPGYVPDEVLVLLYQAAKLCVFPSLYEGYGLPVAEAMACRTPVVASATSSLLELVTNEEALFDPHDVGSIRSTIERALTDSDLLTRLRREELDERHTWREVAARTAHVYEEIASLPAKRLSPRPRIAFAAPSGGHEGNAAIISALLERGDLDLLVEDDAIADVQAGAQVRRVSRASRVGAPLPSYDHIVMSVDEARWHTFPISALNSNSVVLAHDVTLAELAQLFAENDRDEPSIADEFRLTRQVIKRVNRFAVESKYAEQLARLCAAPGDEGKIVRVPCAYPSPEGASESERQPGLIATVGLGRPVRGLPDLLRAFADVATSRDDTELVVVGKLPRRGRGSARKLIDELGLGERVRLVEDVAGSVASAWLRRATIAVQLFDTALEASTEAGIADCLAAGVPTIASEVGAIREVPEQCAVKLEAGSETSVLARLILQLLDDKSQQESLRSAGIARAEQHSPARAARALCTALGLDAQDEKHLDLLRGLLHDAEVELVVADVGCRWGFHERWESLEPNVQLVGFEPDADEARRLKRLYGGKRVEVAPLALGKDERVATLHIARDPGSSSLYEPTREVVEHRPELSRIEQVGAESVQVTTLDAWAARTNLGPVHVLKLDVQGAELDVLEGAVGQLETVRLIESEVEFNPMYEGQPLYADIDRFLRAHGFVLWRLRSLVHYEIAGQSSNFVAVDEQVFENRPVHFRAQGGQLFWGHAYYVPRELAFGTGHQDWCESVRDAAITSAYSFFDLSRQALASAQETCPHSMVSAIARTLAAYPTDATDAA